MKLYHGTTEAVARLALTEGLKPRRATGKDNWAHTVNSSPDCVYLTTAYAAYFAINACGDNDRPAIIEIDTDGLESRLLPDEDFLEQGTRGKVFTNPLFKGMPKDNMERRTRWFRARLRKFAHLWESSIKHLGTCGSWGGVPAEYITRVVTWNAEKAPGLNMACIDPTITLINYQICADKYIALNKWIVTGKITEADKSGMANGFSREQFPDSYRAWDNLETLEGVREVIYPKEAARAAALEIVAPP